MKAKIHRYLLMYMNERIAMKDNEETLRKISQLKKEHALMNEELKKEQKKNEAKSNYIASLNHELRTPVNAIAKLCEKLKEEELPDKNRGDIEQIHSCAIHLTDIINDVLDLSQIEAGKSKLNEVFFDLRDLIKEVNDIIIPLAENKGIDYRYKIYPLDPLRIGDTLKIKQVLINILGNAIKYSRENGRVRFSVREKEEGLLFLIADNGIGMSEETLSSLFEAYQQENKSEGSSGLGLCISKHHIDLMKGSIKIRSKRSIGTLVRILLPLRKAMGSGNEKQGNGLKLDGLRILVGEDVVINAKILMHLLEENGAKAELAENGKIALEMFEESKENYYDCLILDVCMPVLNGREVASKIRLMERSDARKIPIIALSADCFREDEQKSVASGMDLHLCKPVDPQKLITSIQNLKSRDG